MEYVKIMEGAGSQYGGVERITLDYNLYSYFVSS